ncbi:MULTISPECIES: DUF4404 family protein [unclassified Streptomyces]|uniref:DUF4404 family protein n=1 Tax=unclassified Streptomyces TaxID=2593676 RepID=UPI0036667BCB
MSDHVMATDEHLKALRAELLASGSRLSPEEREHLESLLDRLEADREAAHTGVGESLNHSAEKFEVRHPALAAALRNLGVSLANIGI